MPVHNGEYATSEKRFKTVWKGKRWMTTAFRNLPANVRFSFSQRVHS
jgi:hypothetical protein